MSGGERGEGGERVVSSTAGVSRGSLKGWLGERGRGEVGGDGYVVVPQKG